MPKTITLSINDDLYDALDRYRRNSLMKHAHDPATGRTVTEPEFETVEDMVAAQNGKWLASIAQSLGVTNSAIASKRQQMEQLQREIAEMAKPEVIR